MTNLKSKPIPKKQRQIKAFAKAIIPLWPRATWVPEKENSIGEKTRSLKLERYKDGKTLTKSFKIFRSGSPEEWILWRTDFNKVCVGMSISTRPACSRMIRQVLLDKPLKEFERVLILQKQLLVATIPLIPLPSKSPLQMPTPSKRNIFDKESGSQRR
jgi:hypothetical protein